MKTWCVAISLAWGISLTTLVSAYGTTVSIALSYCPATTTSTSLSTSTTSASPTNVPSSTPFFLYISGISSSQRQYVAANASVTTDTSQALAFVITTNERLSSGRAYISTSGREALQEFSPSTDIQDISTSFSVTTNKTLAWKNSNFVNGQAGFCVSGSIVQVGFIDNLPADCLPVSLKAIAIADVITLSTTVSSSNTISQSTAQLQTSSSSSVSETSSSSTTSVTGTISSYTTTTEYSAPTTSGTPACYDGSLFDGTVNEGYLILCNTDLPGDQLATVQAEDLAECLNVCNSYISPFQQRCVAVEFDILEPIYTCRLKYAISIINRGANPAAAAAIIVNEPWSPPIVFQNLSSTSTHASPTTNTTPTTGTTRPSTIVATSTISTSFIFSSMTTRSLTLSSFTTTNLQSGNTMTSASSLLTSSTASTSNILSSTTSSIFASSSSLLTSAISSTISSSQSTATVPSSSPTLIMTTTAATSSSLITTTTSSAINSCQPMPTVTSLCPSYNHRVLNVNGDGACFEIECSTTLQGNILTGNSSTASSLNTCIAFCNLYNVALPYGCLGVIYTNANVAPNCLLLSTITGSIFTPGQDSGRLIYPGYPSITDSLLGPSISTTTASTSTLISTTTSTSTTTLSTTTTVTTTTTTATTTTTLTSTSTSTTTTTTPTSTTSSTTTTSSATPTPPLVCSPAPTTSECPATSPICYAYNYYSAANYEIECSTVFTGAQLQPLLAFSLSDCIQWCQNANAITTNSCIGVSFIEGSVTQGGINNCFRYSSLGCATRGNATWDSARLLYSGYQQMNDYANSSFICA